MTDLDRFATFVRVLPNGCHEWTGAVSDSGYPEFTYRNRRVRAHRWIFGQKVRKLRPRETVDHECHNRSTTCRGGPECRHRRCVNETHLRAVTTAQNLRNAGPRVPSNANRAKTHCPAGHPYDATNTLVSGGLRHCRACRRKRERERRRRLRGR